MKSALLSTLVNRLTAGRIKYGWYSSNFSSAANAVFIGGASRSGTTLLWSILTSHSRLSIARETGLCGGTKNLDLLSNRTGLPVSQLEAIYKSSRCASDFTERVLTTLMQNNGKARWGDKLPSYIRSIDKFFKDFPNSCFIHIIRDGRDVVCSLRTHEPSFRNKRPPNEKLNSWDDCIEDWVSSVQSGLAYRGDKRYYEVRYESLVNSPESAMRALCDWLGEPWEAETLEKSRKAKVGSHPEVSKPINRDATARWKFDLPKDARERFRGIPNELLTNFGYVDDESWIDEPVQS
ncbi:MAG: sulfotransferase family protein [Burkholderiales bacterium]